MTLTMTVTVTPEQAIQIAEMLKGATPDEKPAVRKPKNAPALEVIEGQTSLPDPLPVDGDRPDNSVRADHDPAGPDAQANSVTRADVFAKAAALAKAGKQKALSAAFAVFGAKKFSDFDAMPEKFGDLMAELVKIDG